MEKYTISFVVHTSDRCNLDYELSKFLYQLNEEGTSCDPNSLTFDGPECTAVCCVDHEAEE